MEARKVSLIVKGNIVSSDDVGCGFNSDIICYYKESSSFSQEGNRITIEGRVYDVSDAHVIGGNMVVSGDVVFADGTVVLVEKQVIFGVSSGFMDEVKAI